MASGHSIYIHLLQLFCLEVNYPRHLLTVVGRFLEKMITTQQAELLFVIVVAFIVAIIIIVIICYCCCY